MFNSLRSRLWLTYALIVLLVVEVVLFALVVTLRQSPFLYQQTIYELEVTTELWGKRLEPLVELGLDALRREFISETGATTIQAAIVDDKGAFIVTNSPDNVVILQTMAESVGMKDLRDTETDLYKDPTDQDWFYHIRDLGGSHYLLTAVTKPTINLRTIVQDEFMKPIVQAVLIVIVLTFFISLIIGNWIALPLKRMSRSAEALSEGELIEIPLEGPKEVRKLAHTFNLMSKKITASSQSQREFIANVSHEFKTPLTSIQGFAQAIKDGTVKSKKDINKVAGVILIETNRLYRLMMDLLMLVRLDAGTANMCQEEIHMPDLLQNMVDKFSLQAEQKGVALLTTHIPRVQVLGDGDRLAQVFSNLIDNALYYTPSGGKVEISAESDGREVSVSIQDLGIGIPDEEKEKIFERFYQINSSRKHGKKKGFGLGLSIAREIVQSHHGKIWVEDNPDKGSIFFVKLPIIINKS